MCVSDGAEGGEPAETDELVPALEAAILQAEREDTVLRSDRQGEPRPAAQLLGCVLRTHV